MKFSVLIAVYAKEQPANLQQSLESIFRQELPPTEVILMEDGPLTAELEAVVAAYSERHPELHIVKCEKNRGLGLTLREGMHHCHYDIIARMDSDDIAKPERFQKETAYLEAHPQTDIVGSWVDEFQDAPEHPISIRKVPETHELLKQFSHSRNPMNHPTVMFRKKAVIEAGNYRHCPLFEDYDLWVRMMINGARFHNLQESLLLFRMTPQMFSRRGGSNYTRQEIRFQRSLYRIGYIGLAKMIMNIVSRTFFRIIPGKWRKYGYLFFLRR